MHFKYNRTYIYDKIKYSLLIYTKLFVELSFIATISFFQKKYKPEFADKIHNIIIPLLHGIGDPIIFSACFHRLKNIFTEAKITILTTEINKEIISDTFPEIDINCQISLLNLLKLRSKYDLMILPSRNLKQYIYSLIINPRYLMGYNYTIKTNKKESYVIRVNRILQQLGCLEFVTPYLFLSDQTIDHSRDLLRMTVRKNYAYIFSLIVGGRWKTKTYSSEKYRILIHHIRKLYTHTVILLIGDQEDLGEYIANNQKGVHNFSGKTTLREVMGLIYHSDLVIGPDGGLLNIAMGFDKPIVGLFGPVDPKTIISHKYKDQTIFTKKCDYQPCYNEEHQPICPFPTPYCMDIEISAILEKINNVHKNRFLLT